MPLLGIIIALNFSHSGTFFQEKTGTICDEYFPYLCLCIWIVVGVLYKFLLTSSRFILISKVLLFAMNTCPICASA